MRRPQLPARQSRPHDPRRRGAVLVLAAFLMVFLVGVVAMAVDYGYIVTVQTELKRATDAGALAGANALVNGSGQANQAVLDIIAQNRVGTSTLSGQNVTIQTGTWDSNTRSFTATNNSPSAVRVVATTPSQAFFFAPIFGQNNFTVQNESIAVYQPRDIMIVLDFSGSMNDDTELNSIGGALTAASVEANLLSTYALMGLPQYGSLGNTLVTVSSNNNTTIRNTLGLTGVTYPFAQGSWTEYFNYVKGNSLPSAYRKRYGKITLVDYWLSRRDGYNETNLLWKGDPQPVTAVKDAVSLFLAYLQANYTDDQVGFTLYTAADGTAIVEKSLTKNMTDVETTVRQRQAGHYVGGTNIGDGIKKGREDLVAKARPGAFKMMVLMTDGQANAPSGVDPDQYALDQAALCAAAKIPIVCISLGAGADTSIMNSIASTTGGVHFNVPGGQTVSAYEQQLKDVFKQVADDRPLKLVK